MTNEEAKKVLEQHRDWLNDDPNTMKLIYGLEYKPKPKPDDSVLCDALITALDTVSKASRVIFDRLSYDEGLGEYAFSDKEVFKPKTSPEEYNESINVLIAALTDPSKTYDEGFRRGYNVASVEQSVLP